MVDSGHGLFRMGSFPVKATDPPADAADSPTPASTRSSSWAGSKTSSEVIGAASTRRILSLLIAVGSGIRVLLLVTALVLSSRRRWGGLRAGLCACFRERVGQVVALRTAAATA